VASPTWVTFAFEVANFLLLVALLGWIFFRPVRNALERRRAALEAEQKAAAETLEQAQHKLAEANTRRQELETELAKARERAHRAAKQESDRIIEEGRQQANRERQALEAELLALRHKEAHTAVMDAASSARDIVVGLLRCIDGQELEIALRNAACAQAAKLAAEGGLAQVIVESAQPLDAKALTDLSRAVGQPEQAIVQRIVPELVAGLRILTSRGMVDVSATGIAAHTEQALIARIDAEEEEHA